MKRGRPKKEHKENKRVTMYLKSPLALLIHSKLAKQGQASDKYERYLLETYSPLLTFDERITVLHAEQHKIIEEHAERRQQMGKDYAFKIERLDWQIQELKKKKAESETVIVLQKSQRLEVLEVKEDE